MAKDDETYDLASLSLPELTRLSASIRKLGAGAASAMEAAESVVSFLHERLAAGPAGDPACARVQLFMADAARVSLLASAGDGPGVVGEEGRLAERTPFLMQLLGEVGLGARTSHVLVASGTDPLAAEQVGRVGREGILSVVGLGGSLGGGVLFAIVLLAKIAISPAVSEMLHTLALGVRVSLVPFYQRVSAAPPGASVGELRAAALEDLLLEQERIARWHADEMQELVSKQRWQLQATFNSIADGIIIADGQGSVTHMNEAAWRLLGTLKPEAIAAWPQGFGFFELDGESHVRASQLPLAAALEGQSVDRELILRRPVSATDIHLSVSARPIQDLTGTSLGAVSVFRNITERVRFQKALILAREAAEAGSRSKSEFLATMSHEIRTPMNGVIGMTGLLLETQLTAEQRDIAETIRTSGEALLVIINDILDFSKIESQNFELENQPFDLRTCIEDTLELLARPAAAKRIELAALLAPDLPRTLVGDAARLRQILLNLLSNAVKFTHRGEVLVFVSAEPEAPGGKLLVHLSVRDTGIGIAEEKLDRLFRSFSQVDASINRRYGGTGLGLAISRSLVERMGGQIWVESKTSEGSTFHVTIRVSVAPDPPSLPGANGTALKGLRVLVADEHPVSRQILELHALAFGMVPSVVSGLEGALAALRDEAPFSAVVLAVPAPEEGAPDPFLRMASEPSLRRAPLVLLVPTLDAKVRRGAERLGAAAWLHKPPRRAHLHDALASAVGSLPTRSTANDSPRADATLAGRLPLRILIAEDNPVNQKVMLLFLRRLGYSADAADNGREVLAAVGRRAYDLILMDMQMPEMDGLEATRRLRQPGVALGSPRVIAVTANVLPADREACHAAGMDGFLMKPIKVEDLVAVLSPPEERGEHPSRR